MRLKLSVDILLTYSLSNTKCPPFVTVTPLQLERKTLSGETQQGSFMLKTFHTFTLYVKGIFRTTVKLLLFYAVSDLKTFNPLLL